MVTLPSKSGTLTLSAMWHLGPRRIWTHTRFDCDDPFGMDHMRPRVERGLHDFARL